MTNNERYPGNDIHPTALIAEGVQIGTGNYIGPYCVIGFPPEWKGKEHFSGRVIIGDNNRLTGLVTVDSGTEASTAIASGCYIMKSAHVGHDCVIYESVTISCGAKIGGNSFIHKNCVIGLNAVIHQNMLIPRGCMIGASSFVGKKSLLIPNGKYAGVPVRYLGENVKP